MKKYVRMIAAVLCLVLLCTAITGCVSSGLEKPTTSTEPGAGTTVPVPPTNGTTVPATQPTEPTQSTVPSTAPTEPDDGNRTVLLTTQGGMQFAGLQVNVYADAELTQLVTVVRTDENGMASFRVEPGSICYAKVDFALNYDTQEAFAVTEPVTHIQLVSQLVDPDFRRNLELGDIMYDLDCTDLNDKPYRLADAIAAGKHTIMLHVRDAYYLTDQVLLGLQQVYENYGDQLDVVIVCHSDMLYEVREQTQARGITYPVVTVFNNRDWIYLSHVTVVDRYGMLVFSEFTHQMKQETIDGLVTYFTMEGYQQRLFENGRQMLDCVEGLQAGVSVTYQVKVVDGNGTPLQGILLKISYKYRAFSVRTDEQGIASWSLYPRDDIKVEFNRNEYDYRLYIFENEGIIEAGTTEKTLVMRDVETVSYTVRVVDSAGNPLSAPCIRTIPYNKVLWPDENGLIQWEGVELEEPFTVDTTMHNGYLFGGVTREGNVFTILLHPQVTYYITVVDEKGNPLNGLWVAFYEEGIAENVGIGATVTNGIAKIYAKAGAFSVEIYDTEVIDGIWYRIKYGVFELEEGVTEITFVVGKPEVEKMH